MPPFFVAIAVTAGAVVTARFLKREWQRVNRELDAATAPVPARSPTLRRDPQTGVWRLE